MIRNLILATDSYKSSHYLQYPPEMDGLFSYFESRGGDYPHVVFFGLQAILKEYLRTPICQGDIDEAEDFFKAHGEPFNREGWDYINNEHGGYLPVSIKAAPEGLVVPSHNVLFTVESTDPKCAWVVNYIETLLVRTWYPTTVATLSYHAKRLIYNHLMVSADMPDAEIPFKLHDFGARGVSSGESAALGGAAHLVNFMGSDTVEGVVLANRLYGMTTGMAGFSIPATEHSTITSWGREGEASAYENVLAKFAKPGALVACVSDSYNLWNAIENIWGGPLRQKVIDSGATVVIRPDSGTPHQVVLKCLQMLDAKFGHTINTKGYKVLNNVRVIQGDGITPRTIPIILDTAMEAGYSASNIAFGMGGGLLQQVTRDTLKFAYKASAAHFPGRGWVGINKDPITDPGKASKAGRVSLYRVNGELVTTADESWADNKVEVLREVFHNGRLLNTSTFDEVRERAARGLNG